MWLLIEDFVRRHWLVFSSAVLWPMTASVSPYGPLFMWAMLVGPVSLLSDAENGARRTYETLPVQRKTLGRIAWFEGVVLFPLSGAPILGIGWILGAYTLAHIVFIYVTGMGLSSAVLLTFLIEPGSLRRRGTANVLACLRLLICVAFSGGLAFLLVRGLDSASPTLKTLTFIAALALNITAFLFAERLGCAKGGTRAVAATGASRRRSSTKVRMPGRWAGFVAPWLRDAASAFVACAVTFAACRFLPPLLASNGSTGVAARLPSTMVVLVAAGVCCFQPAPWFASVRALRVLPLSRRQLVLIYLSLTCLVFCAVLAAERVVYADLGGGGQAPLSLAFLLLLLGVSFLLNIGHLAASFAPILTIPMLCVILFISRKEPIALPDSGIVLALAAIFAAGCLAVGAHILQILLTHGSNLYRRKPVDWS